jgi:Tat protein secretion system quality control protein TatD with DNase activity
MLHVRASKGTDDAYYDALEILQQYSSPLRGVDSAESLTGSSLQEEHGTTRLEVAPLIEELSEGLRSIAIHANFHFFSGSTQCMLDIIDAGFTVSVDGPITFVNEYDEMIIACPIDKIMIETDAPFAAPVPYRGKTCEPWMVVEIAKKIAELKGMDLETLRVQLLENSKTFFGI